MFHAHPLRMLYGGFIKGMHRMTGWMRLTNFVKKLTDMTNYPLNGEEPIKDVTIIVAGYIFSIIVVH